MVHGCKMVSRTAWRGAIGYGVCTSLRGVNCSTFVDFSPLRGRPPLAAGERRDQPHHCAHAGPRQPQEPKMRLFRAFHLLPLPVRPNCRPLAVSNTASTPSFMKHMISPPLPIATNVHFCLPLLPRSDQRLHIARCLNDNPPLVAYAIDESGAQITRNRLTDPCEAGYNHMGWLMWQQPPPPERDL